MKTRHGMSFNKAFIAGTMVVCLSMILPLAVFAQGASDAEITSAINTEMRIDNAVSANNIDVTTVGGIVTLTGTVDNILAKERAQALAEATVGVRAIVNRVNVEPVRPRTDKELEVAVENAWLLDPATQSYRVNADADDGIVMITGTVSSYAEKELSATVAKGVRGVKEVINEIEVDYQVSRHDREIKNEIIARLENDVRVDDLLINVEVDDGDVLLTGTVGSLQEKNRAYSDSWVAGVNSVDSTGLEIKWWVRDELRRSQAYDSRSDDKIQKAIEEALGYDPRIIPYDVTVEVSDGMVTLSGTVDNPAAKRAAEQDARNTLGVWRVTNNIKVRPEVPADDQLETRVAEALQSDPYVDRFDIKVEAYNGWVYLAGEVNTSFEKNRAERVTERVQGVIGVVNYLEYNHLWVWAPDWEIQEDVRSQLTWSPFVDASGINVAVNDGVVTLTGSVGTWSEREDAEKNAFQGGAKDVINSLTVDYRYYGPYGPGYYGSPDYRGPGYYGPSYEPYP